MTDEHEPSKRQPIASPPRKAYNAMGDAAKAMGAKPPFSSMGEARDQQQIELAAAQNIPMHRATIDDLPEADAEYLREHGSEGVGEYPFNTLTPPAIIAPAPKTVRPGWRALPSESLPAPTYYPVVMGLAITLIAWGRLRRLLSA